MELPHEVWQIAAIGGVFLVCSAIQSTVGFAFTLFALPILLWVGIDLPSAVMMTIVGSMVQRLLAVHHLRRSVDWRGLAPLMLFGLGALPLGILTLKLLSQQRVDTIRQVIGALILAAVATKVLLRIRPRDRVRRGWGYAAAAASGYLGGLANMTGPPFLLWVHSHRWANEQCRVALLAFTLPMVPVQIALLLGAYGVELVAPAVLAAVLGPLAALGCMAGLRLGRRLPIDMLRVVAFALLAVIGIVSIVRPLFR
jgi:uncharacterized membrane protein YfcA